MPALSSVSHSFKLAPITCPGCHRVIAEPLEQCPSCGYNAWTCVDHFPYPAPPLDRYVDVENRLTNDERARLDRVIESVEGDLPQVRLYVCLVRLLPGTDARECGFWMMNASIPRDDEEAERRPWSVLLLIDLAGSAASATVGYGLDPFVSDAQLKAALGEAREDWQAANWAGGIQKFVHGLHQALRQAHKAASHAARKNLLPVRKVPAVPSATSSKARHPEV
jgi:uncharacterized membrane protein YgcG